VTVGEETIGFELRLNATDQLDEGDAITEQFGILPRLATLEAMVAPKDESLLGQALGALLGSSGGFSLTRSANPPLVLFIWGRTRVLPVNINSMNVTETEFSAVLNPVRASVAVSLTVIEGKSPFYLYSKAAKEANHIDALAAGRRTVGRLPQRVRDADRGDGSVEPALQGRKVGTRFDARVVVLARHELPAREHPAQGGACRG
jgi:hypothetical protein